MLLMDGGGGVFAAIERPHLGRFAVKSLISLCLITDGIPITVITVIRDIIRLNG